MRTPILAMTLATAGSLSAGVSPVIPRVPDAAVARLTAAAKPAAQAPEVDESLAAIAERIVAQGRAAGDRLKEKDSGRFTQQTQQEILDDIDKLLKPPPPMGGDGGPPPPPMGGMPPPMGGDGDGMPPPMPMGGGSKPPPMPMGGGKGPPQSRGEMRQQQREREQQAGMPPGQSGQPMPGGKEPGGPMPGGAKPMGGDKPMPGIPGDGNGNGAPPPPKPALPPDDAATKQVWGHLPDRLRQEMNQYYKEQFMPKYNDMLRQYYGRLAERDKGAKK